MPNHVNNALTVRGTKEQIAAFVAGVKSEKQAFDFNSIIPMPPTLHVTSGGRSSNALAIAGFQRTNQPTAELTRMLEWPWVKEAGVTDCAGLVALLIERDTKDRGPILGQDRTIDMDMSLVEFGALLENNIKEYGHATWYDWAVANWGTKWNAYSLDGPHIKADGRAVRYTFDTAWSSPEPIILALVDKYGVSIDVEVSGEVDRPYSYGRRPMVRDEEEA